MSRYVYVPSRFDMTLQKEQMTGSLSTTSAKSIQMIAKMQSNIAGDAPSEHFDGQQAN